jgi:adenylate cyclase
MENPRNIRILFPIGLKLVVIISILLLVALGTVTFLVSMISTQDARRGAEDNNFTVNRRAGSQANSAFEFIENAVLAHLEMLDQIGEADPETDKSTYFFSRNRNIAAIATVGDDGAETIILNNAFFLDHNADSQSAADWFAAKAVLDETPPEGQIRLVNSSPQLGIPLCAMLFSRQNGDTGGTAAVLFSVDELAESFGTGINTSFIVDSSGELLLHSDEDLVLGGANFSALPIVEAMQQNDGPDRQISYTGPDGLDYFGAYYRVPRMSAAVITIIPQSVVFEAVRSITRQNLMLTAAVLFLTVLFIWFFSKTISYPARSLAAAAQRIEQGEFELKLIPRSRDELGFLTDCFGKMSSALGIFGRFTNRDIALRAMKGEIKPGGLPKHATIFFSDIRGFTEKSEKFTIAYGDDASNHIVRWLNEYFTRMVECVEKTGGVVDKFIGDAVMAHWGTAFTAGSPARDAFNCVKAAVMMRTALLEMNASRSADDPGNPEIRIGCGINTGIVTAGQIGSEQRMEYTVIGDPVNLASRTEALNKPLGTDILITENTWNLIGNTLVAEEMPPVQVKGKEAPIRMFAVINLKGAPGPQTLEELRTLLHIPAPDLSKVDTNAEEQKYHIAGN